MVRQSDLIAVVGVLLIGSAVLLVVGVSGVQAEASQEKKQGHSEATKEQEQSGGAASEADRCTGTRTIVRIGGTYLTNDLPGCPNKGGLLSAQLPDTGRNKISDPKYPLLMGENGDDKVRGLGGPNELYGGAGSDEVRGLGGLDELYGGPGSDVLYGGSESPPSGDFVFGDKGDDVIYGGDGDDYVFGGKGADVIYGGDGNDTFEDSDGQRDKLYCGNGKDEYGADKIDYVDSSCEKGKLVGTGGPPLILLTAAALCSALMMLRYVIRSV